MGKVSLVLDVMLLSRARYLSSIIKLPVESPNPILHMVRPEINHQVKKFRLRLLMEKI